MGMYIFFYFYITTYFSSCDALAVMKYNCSACIKLEEIPSPKKIINCKSLGRSVAYYNSLAKAITLYMSPADGNLCKLNSFTETILSILKQVHLNLTNLNTELG